MKLFHRKHFPGTPLPQQFFLSSSYEQNEYEDEEDDGLGYYPDGVKRTLTDTQISIFRHSEIQRILRKEAGDLTGPIFPKRFQQKQFKTHVRDKGRLKEKKVAQGAAEAEKEIRKVVQAQHEEVRTATEAKNELCDEQEGSPVPSTRSAAGKKGRKRKNKNKNKTNPTQVTRDAATAWKTKPERNAKLKRRNTSSPEPEVKHVSKKVRDADNIPKNMQAAERQLEVRHDPKDYKSEGEEFTYRRLARDEDAVPNVSIDLDY